MTDLSLPVTSHLLTTSFETETAADRNDHAAYNVYCLKLIELDHGFGPHTGTSRMSAFDLSLCWPA